MSVFLCDFSLDRCFVASCQQSQPFARRLRAIRLTLLGYAQSSLERLLASILIERNGLIQKLN